jgi:membrane-anchored mycosin MYCP
MRTLALASLLVAGTLAQAGCAEPEDNRWALEATQLDVLAALLGRSATVRVALLDTGIDLGHPALAHLADGQALGGELADQRAFVGGTVDDRNGHGTFLAGLLAARPRQGLSSLGPGDDAQGFAPEVSLLVGRVCVVEDCSLPVLAEAIRWALDHDAAIISLSLGFTPSEVLPRQTGSVAEIRALLARAEEKGVLVVAASANRGPGELFPASEPTVLAVGAADRGLQPRNGQACGGSGADLLAPGEGIVGPWRGRQLAAMDGTSAAVPFVVAAAAGLMAASGQPQDAHEVRHLRHALTATARPVGDGCGLLQAAAALQAYA